MLKKHKQIMPIILIIVTFLFLISLSAVSADTHNLNGLNDTDDIQNVINTDTDNELVINLADGSYSFGQINISRNATIIGQSKDGVRISSIGSGTLFNITASNVNLINLTISGYQTAIKSNSSYLNIVENNITTNDIAIDIRSEGGDLKGISIENNIVSSSMSNYNYGAVYIYAPSGSIIFASFIGNNITANGVAGTGVRIQAIGSPSNLTFINNNITGRYDGVYLYVSTNNNTNISFTKNNITGTNYAINILASTSNNNTISFTGNNITGTYGVYMSVFSNNKTNIIFTDNNINGTDEGVYLFGYISNNSTINFTNNNITGYYTGVYIEAYRNNNTDITFINNNITGRYCGVYFETYSSSYTKITFINNNITGRFSYGVGLESDSSNNTNLIFTNNKISGTYGVLFNTDDSSSTDINFTNNNITGTSDAAVYIDLNNNIDSNIIFDTNDIQGVTYGVRLNTLDNDNLNVNFCENDIGGEFGIEIFAGNSNSSNINFTNNNITGIYYGVTLWANDINDSNIIFDNNNIQGSLGVGLQSPNSNNVNLNFNKNIITGDSGIDIYASNSDNINISLINNEITGAFLFGASLWASYINNSNIVFDNNTIQGLEYGVQLMTLDSDNTNVNFGENNITGEYGVYFDTEYSDNININFTNNEITGTLYDGVYLSVNNNLDSNILLDNNIIEGISRGIILYTYYGDNITVNFFENYIIGNRGVYFDAEDSINTNIDFTNNEIMGRISNGLSLYLENNIGSNILFDNNIIEGANRGVYIDADYNDNVDIDFINNIITGMYYGVYLASYGSNNTNITLNNNFISGLLNGGVELAVNNNKNSNIIFNNNNIEGVINVGLDMSNSENINVIFTDNNFIDSTGSGYGIVLNAIDNIDTSILFDNNIIEGSILAVYLNTVLNSNINLKFTNNNLIGVDYGVVLDENDSINANIIFMGNNIIGRYYAFGITYGSISGLSLLNNTFVGDDYGLYFFLDGADLSNIIIRGNTILANDTAIFFEEFWNPSFVNITVNYNRIIGNNLGLNFSTNDNGSNFDYNWWGVNDISTKIIGFNTGNHYILNITNTTSLDTAKTRAIINFALLVLNTNLTNEGVENLPYFIINGTFNGLAYSTNTNDLFIYQLTIPASGLQNITAKLDYEYVELKFNASKSNINSTIIVPKEAQVGKQITIRGVVKDENGNLLANVQLTVTVGGVTYIVTTNSAGDWSLIYKPTKLDNIQIVVRFVEDNRYFAFTNSTIFKAITGTVLSISAPTINQGKKTNIKVILKDLSGNILKGKKISLSINGKTYTITTNNKGIAIFNIDNLKGGKHKFSVKYAGDSLYKSSVASKVQNVKAKVDLAISSIKKLKSANKKIDRYKVTIINKGSLKSKVTTLRLFHIRNGIKIKSKNVKVKAIKTGKKISVIISYYPDKAYHRYCKAYFTVDPKNKNKEVSLKNNNKVISLKY